MFLRYAPACLLLAVATADAATFYVNDINDSGPGTLRAAILAANATPNPPHTIEFHSSFLDEGMVELMQTLPIIEVPLIIDGAGKNPIVGSWESGLYFPLLRTRANLELRRFAMTRGRGDRQGGCVNAESAPTPIDLVVDDMTFSLCTNIAGSGFARGGAIRWEDAESRVSIRNSRFEYNVAVQSAGGQASGGAVYAGGTIEVEGSVFNENSVSGDQRSGGAISTPATLGASVSIKQSSFRNNTLQAVVGSNNNSMGGAITVDCYSGCDVEIEGSYFEGNHAAGGGAIFFRGHQGIVSATVTNTSFISNRGELSGGAINAQQGSLTIRHSTFHDNYSATGGHLYLPSATVEELSNSILGDVATGSYPACWFAYAATLASGTFYPSGSVMCSGVLPGAVGVPNFQVVGVDRTERMPVLEFARTSPIIDAGDASRCLPTDALGTTRPQDGNGDGIAACDAGAYEHTTSDRIFRNGFD
jgi:predicted outer membrane repeat protein